ncbi:AraC family transcriptional regulator [Microvirga sp. P5_D2]
MTAIIDDIRRRDDFLTIEETLSLCDRNTIYDPFSTLISRHAKLGSGNLFYPCTTIRCRSDSDCSIGDGNTFHSLTMIDACGGKISVGSGNTFGNGGFTAKADRPGARITIGDRGRYASGASVYGTSHLGTGSQILGQVSVIDCVLADGEDFTHADPDERAAVLKGHGPARKLRIGIGEVIFGKSGFDQSGIQRQTDFHPKS